MPVTTLLTLVMRLNRWMILSTLLISLPYNNCSIEPDSQESLIESILECDECISNLESIYVQQRKLLDSTLLDANRIGKH